MPDLARNADTGEVHCAEELPFHDDLQNARWVCIACPVQMEPVAADGARQYLVSPHFRALDEHDPDCDGDGLRRIVTPGGRRAVRRQMGAPAAFPNRLVLVAARPQVARPPDDAAPGLPQVRRYGGQGQGGGDPHDSYARTLHRIVQCYALFPDERHRPLTIPGCQGNTYNSCFEKLVGTANPTPKPPKVYFAEISFQHVTVENNVATVPLYPVRWIPQKDGSKPKPRIEDRYRVLFNMADWSTRRRNGFLAEMERKRLEQKEVVARNAANKVHLFFLGAQDPTNPLLFRVHDARLACLHLLPTR